MGNDTSEPKDAAAVRVFPPGVPLLTLVFGVGLGRLLPIDAGYAFPTTLRYWLGGIVVAGAFFGLGVWAMTLFRKGGQSPNPWKTTPQIEQSGPYRITRNPMYLQMVLMLIGIGLLLENWWILLLTPIAGWILQRFVIVPEEAYLESKFGDDYLDYKRRVRRWI